MKPLRKNVWVSYIFLPSCSYIDPLAPMYISYRGALFIDFDVSLSIAPPFSCFFLVLFYEWQSLFPLRPSCYWPVGDDK